MVLHFAIGGMVNSLEDIEQLIREGHEEYLQREVIKMIAYTLKTLRRRPAKPAAKRETTADGAAGAATTDGTGAAVPADSAE